MTRWPRACVIAGILTGPVGAHGATEDADPSGRRVVVDLLTRKGNFAVGEKWSVIGTVRNKSDSAIWIASETSVLTIPTEILGASRAFFSQFAFLPTLGERVSDRTVRINPGEDYVIEWYVDGLDTGPSLQSIAGRRLFLILREFLFFKPDEYPLAVTVHYWQQPPTVRNNVLDLAGSATVTRVRVLRIDGSPLVLILGAVVGGLLAFIIRTVWVGRRPSRSNFRRSATTFLLGLGGTTVVCGVGVILLERLARSEFPIAIAVKDVWGAVAIGVVLEWWGLKALRGALGARHREANERV